MIFKCKVVYDFQSIEFDFEVNSESDKEAMFTMYKRVLEGLKNVGDEIPNPSKSSKKTPVKEEMASPGQIAWLVNLGYPEEDAKQLTKKQASTCIKEWK